MNLTGTLGPLMVSAFGDELPPWEFIAAALEAGALTPSDVVHHGVIVELVGRSHTVYRVSVGGVVRFFVKTFGPRRGATDGLAEREQAVLSLAATRPAVRALVPPAWPWQTSPDGEKAWNVVATKAVAGIEAWTLDRAGGGKRTVDEAWQALVAALIPQLANFHKATRDLAKPDVACPPALSPSAPWALCLMDGDAPPELWATPRLASLLQLASADPILVRGLREARGMWRSMALIHADLKHDNVVIETDSDEIRVQVLDWEMARVGDPAWDLATLAARLVALGGDAPPWSETNVAAVASLLRIYAQASGLRIPALARRVVLYVGAVLLMLALQHVSTLPPDADTGDARMLVMKARATFAGVDPLTSAVIARTQDESQ